MWRNTSIFVIFSVIKRYTADKRWLLTLMVLLSLGSRLVALGSPYAIGKIINILQEQGSAGVRHALYWVGIFAIIQFLAELGSAPSSALELKLGQHIQHKFIHDSYQQIKNLPLLWHQDHHSGDLISRVNKVVGALTNFINAPGQLFQLGIGFFGPILILLHIMPVVGMITATMAVVTVIFSAQFDKRIKKYTKIANEFNHKVFATMTDYLGNIRTIIILRLGAQTLNDLKRRTADTNAPYNLEVTWRQRRWMGMDFFVETVAIICLIYMLLVYRHDANAFKIGTLVMVINYLRQMTSSLYNTSRFYGSIVQSVTDYESFETITAAYREFKKTHPLAENAPQSWSNMTVLEINFSYKTGSTHLKNLSFTLKRGQKIALVGTSGAGKSTLMSVLRGLYDAQSGSMMIDDMPFASLEPLAALSTLIPQEPEIFENTIRYNITLGLEHSDEEILEACRIACFDTVVADLPHGLDSKINEKGVNLSGGQKQRLALARGIFAIQESSLVLFDEPTSSVDSMTERRMYANLFRAFPDICLISSIHRLNLLSQFDTIWVMDQGSLVQQGSFTDLLGQKDGAFNKLWAAYQQAAHD